MESEKVLMLVFKKNNGKSANFSISFPDDAATGTSVKALGTFMIDNDILSFMDGSKLSELEKAYFQEVSKNAIVLA